MVLAADVVAQGGIPALVRGLSGTALQRAERLLGRVLSEEEREGLLYAVQEAQVPLSGWVEVTGGVSVRLEMGNALHAEPRAVKVPRRERDLKAAQRSALGAAIGALDALGWEITGVGASWVESVDGESLLLDLRGSFLSRVA
jgi:hypothetical protein